MPKKITNIIRGEAYAVRLLFAAGTPLAILFMLSWLLDYPLVLLGSYLWGKIVDQLAHVYTHADGLSTLWTLLGLYLGSHLLGSIVTKLNAHLVRPEIESRSRKNLDLRIMRKLASLDAAFFDDPANRDMLKVAENSRQQISDAMTFLVREVIGIITFAAGLALFISTSPLVSLVYLAACIPGILIQTSNKKKMDQFSLSSVPETRQKDYYRSILTGKGYAQELRLYGLTDYFKTKYNETWNKIRTARYAIFNRGARLSYLATAIMSAGKIFLVVYSVFAVARGEFTLGTLSMLVSMSGSVGAQFALLIRTIPNHLQVAIPRVNHFRSFMEYESQIADGTRELSAVPEIEFRDVCFRYPGADRDVIDHLNLTIPAGQKIALVGLNGAGKSTLIKLLLRFYSPQSGRILLDGHDIAEYSTAALYRLFGICFQDVCSYSMSVRENIALSDIARRDRDADLTAAAKAAGADRVYADFPRGLDADLTRKFNDHGHALSGGQWQKLALARAFFRDAQFIILDEPSSALDPEAEDYLFSSFKTLCKNKGGILISHRLSAIMMVDAVVLLRDGRVLELGSHAELMQQDGEYAKLYRLQAEKYLSAGGNAA